MMGDDDRAAYDDVDDRRYFGFDKKFPRTLRDVHQRDAQRYAEAAAKLGNPALRAFATMPLPVLRTHLQPSSSINAPTSGNKAFDTGLTQRIFLAVLRDVSARFRCAFLLSTYAKRR